ncbi:MAG: glycosyltransferase [Methylomonas sp.]|jgi:lipopolysaccharide biosynthesis glycosyltransferase
MNSALIYVTDKKGFELTIYSISSFVLTQNPQWDIHLFCHDFIPDDITDIKSRCNQAGFNLIISNITDVFISNLLTKGHVTSAAYLKIVCVLALKDQYERILYADNDILFVESINLNNINFDNMPLAAVIDIADCGEISDPSFNETCVKNGVSQKYFNSGFMYFNALILRNDTTIMDRYLEFLGIHQSFCWYKMNCRTNDQCVLNRLFCDQWTLIPLKYNVQGCLKFTQYWSRAAVRHYQGSNKFIPVKPWRDDNKGRRLVAEIEEFLGLTPIKYYKLEGVLFYLNILRNWKSYNSRQLVLAELIKAYGKEFF